MHLPSSRLCLSICCAALIAAYSPIASANTLCVNPSGSHGCYASIQAAVNAALPHDVINVGPGTYKEDVVIGTPLSLLGAGSSNTVINAAGLANGIFVDGYSHSGLKNVIISGFTIKNAQFEGVLVVNVEDAVVRESHIVDNDKFPAVFGSGPNCKGQPAFETDESGDCGGAVHLMGTQHAIVSGNFISGNADGILVSDETGESNDNLIIRNVVTDNPLECGIVLASHPPVGSTAPHYARHFGIDHNTVSENIVSRNGVKVGGAGIGAFSDGSGPGRVSENVIIHNLMTDNGIPGFALHSHVGPNFGAPPDDMDGNMIIGNFIAGNGADTFDTATPGTAGILISSGGGGTPVRGTVISDNVIRDEDIGIAISDPANVDVHLNDLLVGEGKVGVYNVCAYESTACAGNIDATENFWGCKGGPASEECSKASGPAVRTTPWLYEPVQRGRADGQAGKQ